MAPTDFPEANVTYTPPRGHTEEECASIRCHRSTITEGAFQGSKRVVVAWQPDARELERLLAGAPVYLTCVGGLYPHFLTTSFEEATKPA